jgi:hypothetical protein
MADEYVAEGTDIRQPPQDEHIQRATLEQRPAETATATIIRSLLDHQDHYPCPSRVADRGSVAPVCLKATGE